VPRTLLSVVLLVTAFGGMMAWRKHQGRSDSQAIDNHTVLKPRSDATPADPGVASLRHEFSLRAADIHAERETPALAVDAEGRVLLAWASQTGESERTIYLARSSDGGASFESPLAWRKVPIYRFASGSKKGGKAVTYSTHVLPRLAAAGGDLLLGWVEAIDGGPEVAYYVARSSDGGRSFAEPVKTHGGAAGRPGFTTLAASPDGSVLAAWLDGRNGGQQPFAAALPPRSRAFQPEQLVYPGPEGKGICPCCDLAIVRASDGRDIVAFRNTDAGHRDIWLTRSRSDGSPGFEVPVSVVAAPWTFDGCPHDGPALALDGDRLHVLWMDAHTGKGRIYAASSPLGSWSFTTGAVRPETAGAQGHPKAVVRDHQLVATWDEALKEEEPEAGRRDAQDGGHEHGHHANLGGGGRAVMLAVSTDAGANFPDARPVAPRSGAYQLNPALAVAADGAILLAWNELDTEGKRVVFTRVEAARGGIPRENGGADERSRSSR
jgi:hypothetical protein